MKSDYELRKPPLGIIPRKLWVENRIEELGKAIERYMDFEEVLTTDNEKAVLEWNLERMKLILSIKDK